MRLSEWMKENNVSQAELSARISAIGRKPVIQSGVSQWLRKQIPADRVPELVRITDGQVRPHEMRPDLYPEPERNAA